MRPRAWALCSLDEGLSEVEGLGHPESSRGRIIRENKGARKGAAHASCEMGSENKIQSSWPPIQLRVSRYQNLVPLVPGTKNLATCADLDV